MWRFLVWSLRLRRVEYRIAELPIYLIPVLLVVPDASAFSGPVFWEGLVIFLFLFSFGDLLNCLADRDLDSIYKPHLTEAVDGLSPRGVLLQAILSAAAALGLTLHLAWLLDRWLLVPLVALGLFLAYAYSVEPIRLKARGLWQLAFYWLGLFTGPMLFSAMLFEPWPSPAVTAVAVCYGLLQTGVILVNTAEDFPEDRQMGVRTAIVALGLRGGMLFATLLTFFGGLGLIAALVSLFRVRQVPWAWCWGLLPLLVCCVLVSLAVTRVWQNVRLAAEPAAIATVKRSARWVPLWITSIAVACLLVAAAVWLGSTR